MSAPRWARALLARMADPDLVDEVVGDLEEAHRRLVERRGRLVASVLTSLEALDMAFALRWHRQRAMRRLRGNVPPDLPSAGRRRVPPVSWLDFKLGLRMLVRYPAMTVVGGFAMALAIAIGATVFQFVTEAIFPDHPYAEVSRVVAIRNVDIQTGSTASRSLYDFGIWRNELRTVEHLGGQRGLDANLDVGDGRPAPVEGVGISASAFELAPTPPLLGRPILQADEAPDALPVTVLAYELWQSRFEGDEAVVGRVVRIAGEPTTVVGVMPAGFTLHVPDNDLVYVGRQDLWIPFRLDPLDYGPGQGPSIDVFGQLAPGATPAQAQAELTNLGEVLAVESPSTHARLVPEISTFANPFGIDRGIGTSGVLTLMALFIAAVVVTLCANVALLLFARAATREGEIAVRSALGASRGRIVGQLLAEALGLGAVALALGWLGASVGLRWLVDTLDAVGTAEGVTQPPIDASLSPSTMVYAAVLGLAGAVLAGVLPGVKVTAARDGGSIRRSAGRGSVGSLGRLWGSIIVLQVALTTVLVPVAFTLGLRAWRTQSVDRGFPATDYLSVRLEMDREGSLDPSSALSEEDFLALYEERYEALARRLAAEPGVLGVTAGTLPGFHHAFRTFELEDRAGEDPFTIGETVQVAAVEPGFFDVMGARLLTGRAFDSEDQAADSRAVIVNESFLRERLGGGNAIGRRLRYPEPVAGGPSGDAPGSERQAPWMEIVGVVEDLVMSVDALNQAGVYHPRSFAASYPLRMAVHVPARAAAFSGRLRELALETSPALRVAHPLTLDRAGSGQVALYRLFFRIVLVVGGLALLLANAGIYAILSFMVSRRTREIGVRVALGADRSDVVSAILSRMARRVALGVLLGAAPALSIAWAMSGSTMHRTPGGWGLVVVYLALMVAVCMVACVPPIRRALAIEPSEALASEG